jgi:predicted transcriptional regulator of viral defense system
MQFIDFISQNHVFTTTSMLETLGNTPSARVALSRAVNSGRVLKIRSGLYASQSGRFQGTNPDPHLVATTLRKDAVFVYHSALQLHGLAHSVFSHMHYMCADPPAEFCFQGTHFKGLTAIQNIATETLSSRTYQTVRVTTREQTFVDCLTRIGMSGGIEEVMRSFAGLPYADINAILLCLKYRPPSVAARCGWYLDANKERWAVSDDKLEAIERMLSQKASYKLDPVCRKSASYANKWHLNLPVSYDEMKNWMEM